MAIAEKQRRSTRETSAASNHNVSLLANRVDELNQKLSDLQSEKDWQDEQNQALSGRLSAIIDVVPAGVIVLDSLGRICECNALAEELLACSLRGELWREISRQCFKRRSDDGHEISTLAGRRLSVSTRSFGAHEGQIVLLSDQTETRRLQAQVSHQQRLSALGQMVSALAHQIRTPLSAAMLYASHLCDQPLVDAQREKFSHKLRSRLIHMERQVRDMLLFVKGELPLNEQINRQQLLQEINEALEVPITEAQVQLSWKIDGSDFYLRCNRDALVNAFLNLVNNAIQAYDDARVAGNEKKLLLTLCAENNELQISVRDFGLGIDEELLQKLQEPFVTTKPQGTGLGLAVVRAVANAHAGNFSLKQAQPGAIAVVTLPCVCV